MRPTDASAAAPARRQTDERAPSVRAVALLAEPPAAEAARKSRCFAYKLSGVLAIFGGGALAVLGRQVPLIALGVVVFVVGLLVAVVAAPPVCEGPSEAEAAPVPPRRSA